MADIYHDVPIDVPPAKVFDAVSTPAGLDAWWSKESHGAPTVGTHYELNFGPEYHWRAIVTQCDPPSLFELQLTRADKDWNGTRVGFELHDRDGSTLLSFHHVGWPAANDHYRQSSFCWAMYLRCLKRYLEQGTIVPYADRFTG